MLVLELGSHSGKLYCIDTDNISTSDKEFLRARSNYLKKLSLTDKITVLRKHRPSVMHHFKTINLHNVVIDKEYTINP